jgi:release factor glutamine methyltransferase
MSSEKLPSRKREGLGEGSSTSSAMTDTSLPQPLPQAGGGSVRASLTLATQSLTPISDTPRLDAELLMAHALGTTRETLILSQLNTPTPLGFAPLLARRLAHEPLAYITGTRDFWTISLRVAPGVLIPRPDSETLIEAAVDHFGKQGPATILDLGTGSGALLLAALAQWPDATGRGVDQSEAALAIAQSNAAALGLASRATFTKGDWVDGVTGRYDLILCNPPYVETNADLSPEVLAEPHQALFAGADGMDDYRRLIPQLPPLLAAGGVIAVEIGATQAVAVSSLFKSTGLNPQVRKDLAGRDRAIVHFSLGKPPEST